MKKIRTLLKLFLVTAISSAAVLTFGTISGFAMDTGYRNAIECSLNTGNMNGTIATATDSKWYKFVVPNPNAGYGFNLKNMPDDGMFNFEIYYQANADEAPKIYKMTNRMGSSGNRTTGGIMKDAGTYYVRVFSHTGGCAGSYTFVGNIGYGTYAAGVTYLSSSSELGWADCAEMVGKFVRDKDFPGIQATDRNAQKAACFVQNNGATDTDHPIAINAENLSDVADAANYIYSGCYMMNPIFKVMENKAYSISEMLDIVKEQSRPMILALASKKYPTDMEENRYVVLNSVNITTGIIGVKDPSDDVAIDRKVSLSELIEDGYEYNSKKHKYTGNNIICEY